MSQWTPKYNDQQRSAIEHAYCNKLIRNMSLIQRLAEAGELVYEGQNVPPFEIPHASVRQIIKKEEKRRSGLLHTELARKPPSDAVEIIRRRLVSLMDHETTRMEKAQNKAPNVPLDAEHLRKLGRAARELAALPGPGERSTTPGANIPGQGQPQGESRAKPTALAGQLMSALEPKTAPTEPPQDSPTDTLTFKDGAATMTPEEQDAYDTLTQERAPRLTTPLTVPG